MKSGSRSYIRWIRYAVQGWFLLFCIYVGVRFYQFVEHFTHPGSPFVERPPSVEGFLPIAGFMSFKYFLLTGIIEPIHPAAMVIFVAALSVSLLGKKGFCGWICPIGTVSQYLWMAGEKITGKTRRPSPQWDIPLRLVKYVLMSFFLLLIGVAMVPNMMVLFFISDYYKIVDVRTMRFFTQISTVSLIVVLIIILLSLVYRNFWCRYLCPYGALLGLVGMLSPFKIRRQEDKCVHCGRCTAHCPSLIDVERQETVGSPECFGCLTCLSRCPSKGAIELTVGMYKKRKRVRPLTIFALVLILFYLIIGVGIYTGHWKSGLPYDEYRRLLGGDAKKMSKSEIIGVKTVSKRL